MQQAHYNHLIYFHVRFYLFELAKESANELLKNATELHQNILVAEQRILAAQQLGISPLNVQVYRELYARSLLGREAAIAPKIQFENDYLAAELELQDYMETQSKPVQKTIEQIVVQAKEQAEKNYQRNPQPDQRVEDFKNSMMQALNETFHCNFTYKEPLSNGLFMQIMIHPATQAVATVLLLAGLASLTIGICALAGVLPLLLSTSAIALTAAGAGGTFVGVSTLAASFFRQHSPIEIANQLGPVQLPPEDATPTQEPGGHSIKM
ncbi:MAG: hypothetical protein JJT82_10615 [Legionellaceae bacterium]|nr:hypothetical protein [Legionellaceae bacterium]